MFDEIFIEEMSPIDAYNYGKQTAEKGLNELSECEYNRGRTDAIETIKEIYKHQYYCMADMCETDNPIADMCVDCFYEAIIKSIELKEQNK